jgi:hypothetical protein
LSSGSLRSVPEIPPGYRAAGTVTVTLHLASGPCTVRGPLLEHEGHGCLVAPGGVEQHERLTHPEAGEEAT